MSSWFSNGMNKVVAVMVHWNKVSLTLPTSTPTYNTTKKGFVRASVAQISYLCVWIKRSSELAHGAVNSTSFSSCYAAWPSFSKLWTDGKGLQAFATWVMPQPMYLQWLLDIIFISDEWLLWPSKQGRPKAFAGAPFTYCWFGAFFNLQWTTYNRMNKQCGMFLM